MAKAPLKAYKNPDFLNSPNARSIRILSEFLEPLARFRRERIENTIVVFGSARILSKKEAAKALIAAERAATRSGRSRPSAGAIRALETARIAYSMSVYYEDTVTLASMLTRWSNGLKGTKRFVICSGGGPGIMEAANKGARKGGGVSVGLNISLPFEQFPNKYIPDHLSFEFHYFFMRKFWFLYPAKALIMFPGGFGTLDEMMEVLTLRQTGKNTKPLPIILYGRKYWETIINFDEMIRLGMISRADTRLFHFADAPSEAFNILKTGLTKHYLSRPAVVMRRR